MVSTYLLHVDKWMNGSASLANQKQAAETYTSGSIHTPLARTFPPCEVDWCCISRYIILWSFPGNHDSWNLLPNLIGLQDQSVFAWPSGVLEANPISVMLLCWSPKEHSSWEETENGLRIQTTERTPGRLQWGASMNELIKMYSLLLGAAA